MRGRSLVAGCALTFAAPAVAQGADLYTYRPGRSATPIPPAGDRLQALRRAEKK